MYFAYKYAKKKYNQRQEAKTADTLVPETADDSLSKTQPAASQDVVPGDQINTAVTSGDNAAPTDEEKAQPPVAGEHDKNLNDQNDTPHEDPLEKKRRRRYRLKIILGLALPFALQALDTTIVASALPFIAEDFGERTFKNETAVGTTLADPAST
jgi:hypothetical protein